MAINGSDTLAAKKKIKVEQIATQAAAPAGFTAIGTPVNRAELVAQWNQYVINTTLS